MIMNFESEDKIKNVNCIYDAILKEMVTRETFSLDSIFKSVKRFLKVEGMTEDILYEMIENVACFLQKYKAYVEQDNKFIKRSKATITEKVTMML